jgi:hypothetical protein
MCVPQGSGKKQKQYREYHMTNSYKLVIADFVRDTYEHWPSLTLEGAIAYDKISAAILELPPLRSIAPDIFDATIQTLLYTETVYAVER